MFSAPTGAEFRTLYIGPDGTDNCNYDSGREFSQYPGQSYFALNAGLSSLDPVQAVNGFAAQINQITTEHLKSLKKIAFIGKGDRTGKGGPDRPVKPGIGLVKKASRGGRRFTHEQHSNAGRTIAQP